MWFGKSQLANLVSMRQQPVFSHNLSRKFNDVDNLSQSKTGKTQATKSNM